MQMEGPIWAPLSIDEGFSGKVPHYSLTQLRENKFFLNEKPCQILDPGASPPTLSPTWSLQMGSWEHKQKTVEKRILNSQPPRPLPVVPSRKRTVNDLLHSLWGHVLRAKGYSMLPKIFTVCPS